MHKLGLIAGGGELPVLLAEHCAASQRPYFVARITPLADPALSVHPGADHGIGHMGARMEALRAAGCDTLVMIGHVPRMDVMRLDLDAGALAMAPALMKAAPEGDDALLRAVLAEHEKAGFRVVGAEEAMPELLAPAGVWGAHAPSARDAKDMAHAARVAAAIGALDIGQGAVVCAGIVLAVEAQEGTDAMLARVAQLRPDLRGAPGMRRGVLVKRPKPIQERRIDLPVIGVATIEGAARAGLAGVAVEASAALAPRRDAVIAAADVAGVFVYGFSARETDTP